MILQEGIIEYINTRADITGLIGTRVYPMIAPQDTDNPYLIFEKISNDHKHQLSGSSGFSRARIQFNTWSDTYLEAQELAEQIRLNFDGFATGNMGDVYVQSVLLLDDDDVLDQDPEKQIADSYGVRMDYEFWFTETVPTL